MALYCGTFYSVVYYVLCVLFLTDILNIRAYNLVADTDYVYRGPLDSYFGYSVEILNNHNGLW